MRVTFELEPNDDNEITCIFCGSWKCDAAIYVKLRGTGRRTWSGVHTKCATRYNKEMTLLEDPPKGNE